jgi:phosphoribosylanthranilate isomerase
MLNTRKLSIYNSFKSGGPGPRGHDAAMSGILVQIYETQTPSEAETLIGFGVDHIGSVVLSDTSWREPTLRETIRVVQEAGAKSSLIPLFNAPDAVFRTLDYYRPDIVHFCETLTGEPPAFGSGRDLLLLQVEVRKRFPEIRLMRSIPIPETGNRNGTDSLALARIFEPVSDIFLTDTVLGPGGSDTDMHQPVAGFVGITGRTCDWDIAGDLVRQSRIPVILAGGISPDNAYAGLLKVGPAGIDSCTLTNARDRDGKSIRFKKDPEKVHRGGPTGRSRADPSGD